VLGELGVVADLSLSTNHPENLQQRGAVHLQRSLKDKVAMMSRLQRRWSRRIYPDGSARSRPAWRLLS
jgi:hypothetical protein